MIDPPKLLKTAAQTTAVIHVTVPRAEIRSAMGAGRSELAQVLAAQGVKPSGPWFSHHLTLSPQTFDFELGVPVDQPVAAQGRVAPGTLSPVTAARTVYHGGYEGLGAAWEEFDGWIVAQGHVPGPSLRECYLSSGDGADPASIRTELTRPLAGQ